MSWRPVVAVEEVYITRLARIALQITNLTVQSGQGTNSLIYTVLVRIVRLVCDDPHRQDRKVVDALNLGASEVHFLRFGLVSPGV